jgi:hypothetical protein
MELEMMAQEVIVEGRAGANVAVLGYTVAKGLFGDQSAVGQVIKVKQVPLRVIGVATKRGNVFFQDNFFCISYIQLFFYLINCFTFNIFFIFYLYFEFIVVFIF